MEVSHYSCKHSTSASDLATCLDIRYSVFVDEQGCPAEIERDEYDDLLRADHLIVYDDTRAIATGRLRKYEGTTGKIQRVAVVQPYRRAGVGRFLMRELEAAAVKCSFASVILDAQQTAKSFYEKLGYSTISEPFEEAGIQHVRMAKCLSSSMT